MKDDIIAKFAERNPDTSIDHEATIQKFAKALADYEKKCEAQTGEFHTAVHTVFDEFRGTSFNMPALLGYAMPKLKVDPKKYNETLAALRQYVQDNSTDGGAFRMKKGPGGGICRLADQPVAA